MSWRLDVDYFISRTGARMYTLLLSVIFQVLQVKSMEQWTARMPLLSERMR
jgi:hypothetical protein